MKFNDDEINLICEQIKSKYPYLRIGGTLGATTSSYDGSNLNDSLVTIPLESTTVTGNQIELVYRLSAVQINGAKITSTGLAETELGDEVCSYEVFDEIDKDNEAQWRWVYTINLIR